MARIEAGVVAAATGVVVMTAEVVTAMEMEMVTPLVEMDMAMATVETRKETV